MFDIETSLAEGFYFNRFAEGNIVKNKKPPYMLSFACKWLGDKKTHVRALPDYPLYKRNPKDDKALVTELRGWVESADLIIAHYGNKFDVPWLRARCLVNGLPPFDDDAKKYIDTKQVVKYLFKFDSNKLDNVARLLGVGKKLPHTGSDLWLRCMGEEDIAYDKAAWQLMCEYNRVDVEILESVYLHIRPWMVRHPSLTWFSRERACPKCQSSNIEYRGWTYTMTGKRARIHCKSCLGYSSSSEFVKDIKIA